VEHHAAADGASGRMSPDPVDYGPEAIKVPGGARVRTVAGKVAHSVRGGHLPIVLAAGSASLSTTARVLVEASVMLWAESVHIGFRPAFRNPDHRRELLAMHVCRLPPTLVDSVSALPQSTGNVRGAGVIMQVGARSKHASCAGAAAACLRNGKLVTLSAVGVRATANAMMAAAHATHYLSTEGRSLFVLPSAEVSHGSGGSMYRLKLVLALED